MVSCGALTKQLPSGSTPWLGKKAQLLPRLWRPSLHHGGNSLVFLAEIIATDTFGDILVSPQNPLFDSNL